MPKPASHAAAAAKAQLPPSPPPLATSEREGSWGQAANGEAFCLKYISKKQYISKKLFAKEVRSPEKMKLNHFKAQSLQACQSLAQIESEVTHVARQFRCAEFLHYAVEPGTLEMHLNRANFCKQRTCAVCAWLRASKLRIRLFGGMPRLLADYPNAKFLFLTLTIKNCHFQELRSQLRMMQAGWNRMHRSAEFPGIGFLKSLLGN